MGCHAFRTKRSYAPSVLYEQHAYVSMCQEIMAYAASECKALIEQQVLTRFDLYALQLRRTPKSLLDSVSIDRTTCGNDDNLENIVPNKKSANLIAA